MKDVFIELRAKGISFEKISKELNISKPTLIKWAKELAHDIQNQKTILRESMLDGIELSRDKYIERLASLYSRVITELEIRDLEKIPTEKLVKMMCDLSAKIEPAMSLAVRVEKKEFDFMTPKYEEIEL